MQEDDTSRKNSGEDSLDEQDVDVVGEEGLDPQSSDFDGVCLGLLPGALDDLREGTRLGEEWGYETSTFIPDCSVGTNTCANTPGQSSSNFSIASLLERPKVSRGRRPNSKYPRLQACKSFVGVTPPNPGVKFPQPLYPITQPMGFQVERLSSPSPNGIDYSDCNQRKDADIITSSLL